MQSEGNSDLTYTPFVQSGDSLTNDEKVYLLEFYRMYDSWVTSRRDFKEGFNKHLQLIEFYYDDITHNKVLNGLADRKVGLVETDTATSTVLGEYTVDSILAIITKNDLTDAEFYRNSDIYEYRNLVEEKEKKVKKRQKELKEHGDCIVFVNTGGDPPAGIRPIRSQDLQNNVVEFEDDDGDMNRWELAEDADGDMILSYSTPGRPEEEANIQSVTQMHFIPSMNRVMMDNEWNTDVPDSMLEIADNNLRRMWPNVIRSLYVLACRSDYCRFTWAIESNDE